MGTQRVRIDLLGQRFTRLKVIKYSATIDNKAFWECLCDCGKTKIARPTGLILGQTKSCGCLKRKDKPKTHGKGYGDKTYRAWKNMKARCLNKNNSKFLFYGGRGIKIDERWVKDFVKFRSDMGECQDGLSLDRIDPNGNYTLDNCRWLSMYEQHRNTRRNRFLFAKGEKKILSDWARELEKTVSYVSWQLKKGKTMQDICNDN